MHTPKALVTPAKSRQTTRSQGKQGQSSQEISYRLVRAGEKVCAVQGVRGSSTYWVREDPRTRKVQLISNQYDMEHAP